MKKIAMSVAAATMLLGGLTGCGADNQATDMNANYRQTGFQSQDMGAGNGTGTYTQSRYRGQGPVTDMMTPDDRNIQGQRGLFGGQGQRGQGGLFGGQGQQGGLFGNQGQTRTHLNNYNTRGFTGQDGYRANQNTPGMGRAGLTGGNRPGMVDEDGILRGRARNGQATQNVRMHNQQREGAMNGRTMMNQGTRLNQTTGYNNGQQGTQNRQQAMNYHEDYDSRTAQQIANRVERVNGVEDCRVIVHDDDVVVGVETDGNMNQVQQEVERTVKGLTDGKNVRVVTDSDAVNRIRTMDDQLRTGTAFDEIGATFTDMLGDLGRAVQRPFERSR